VVVAGDVSSSWTWTKLVEPELRCSNAKRVSSAVSANSNGSVSTKEKHMYTVRSRVCHNSTTNTTLRLVQ
jgi:hypothetical protein